MKFNWKKNNIFNIKAFPHFLKLHKKYLVVSDGIAKTPPQSQKLEGLDSGQNFFLWKARCNFFKKFEKT